MLRRFANESWRLRCRPAARAFDAALGDPESAQRKVLFRILKHNAGTEFGQRLGFRDLKDAEEFQTRVPAQDFDSLEPMIRRMADGNRNVLTADRVLMFEPSSGSSSAGKLIPYTASLRHEYQRAIRVWIHDLFSRYSAMRGGSAYWSISPLSRKGPFATPGGIAIGYGSDAEYLGRFEQWAAAQSFAVPPNVALAGDLDECLELTCHHLRATPDLAFVSVWSPTFFDLILDRIGADPSELWPRLALVSCWADGSSAAPAEKLAKRLPGVAFQPKGLLATEGVVTIPLSNFGGKVLAVNSHFYEFVPAGGGRPRMAHELDAGGEYTLLLTTGGGLYRYQLGDRVRVSGFAGQTPMLDFIGRVGGVSDLCGEKLNPFFVQGVIDGLRGAAMPADAFAMLAPADKERGYVLFVDEATDPEQIAGSLDAGLSENPHYAYARRLGQLGPPRVVLVGSGGPSLHLARCVELGMRAGDVKPPALDARQGWEQWFGVHDRKEVRDAATV